MTNTQAILILNAIGNIGPSTISKLIRFFGSAQNVLKASTRALAECRLMNQKVQKSFAAFAKDEFLKNELQLMEEHGVRAIVQDDNDYPRMLKEIAGAPVLLYVKGDLPSDEDITIGVVGSRRASYQGLQTARDFSRKLAESGIVVCSGMARGIDTNAHQATLLANGKTVAVLGSGLAEIYPRENTQLFDDIVCGGAVISEFPMTTPPLAKNFPRRNRIISGLSFGVIVVEAALRSGALITADCALEQGREVFAVPGAVVTPSAQGTNNLIKQGAKMVTCIEDILEEIQVQLKGRLEDVPCAENQKREFENRIKDLTETEKDVFTQICDRPVHIDELTNRCEANLTCLGPVLLQLELKHLIQTLPGKWYVREKGNIYG